MIITLSSQQPFETHLKAIPCHSMTSSLHQCYCYYKSFAIEISTRQTFSYFNRLFVNFPYLVPSRGRLLREAVDQKLCSSPRLRFRRRLRRHSRWPTSAILTLRAGGPKCRGRKSLTFEAFSSQGAWKEGKGMEKFIASIPIHSKFIPRDYCPSWRKYWGLLQKRFGGKLTLAHFL